MRVMLTRVDERMVRERRADLMTLGFWLALLLAVILRVSHLGARNLWFDEAWSWFVSQQPLRFILEEGRSNIHPPFLHIVLKYWATFFGDSPAALRTPSLLASVGLVAGTYWLGRQILSRRAALLAAFLLALSPHQIFYAQEARMYALVSALVLGAALAYVRFLRQEGWLPRASESDSTDVGRGLGVQVVHPREEQARADWREAFGYMFSGALALYTHVFGALVLAAMNLHFLGLVMRRARRGVLPHSYWSSLRRWGLWQLGLVILYGPWLTTFVYQVFSRPRQGWRPPLDGLVLVGEFFLFCGEMVVGSFVYPQGVYYALKNLAEYRWNTEMVLRALEQLSLYPLAIGLGVFLLWRGVRRATGAGVLQACFFLPLGLICGVLLVIQQYMDLGRYLMLITPYYFLLLAAGIMSVRAAWKRWLATGLLSLSMILGLKAHYRAPSFDSDYRPVAAVLRQEWRKGEPIVVDPEYLDRCLRYELRGTPISRALPPSDLPHLPLREDLQRAQSARVWLVLDYRSPLFKVAKLVDVEREGWRVVSDRVFPRADSRVRLLLLERQKPLSPRASGGQEEDAHDDLGRDTGA
ncbi:MAG: glycosyltransferase family 39 protein [Blastocatellia bacterium]|nr:glycosyltransferase family 39 protein [Blastocatellia bacterium]MCS7158391.1 glycosyltransferase family 39 protein [Blastocatellia bacterium]MCX7752897.1 glycosyltransferase family 39 protein [Blastocatellia bacterium]MDW8167953.1 glycosyltransferase family 39 protein [Acidobacteriota bacterium]MDW8255978.1 glycosyltransferase family 39 protein [Acidobacteriota bacterium]